VFLPRLVGFNEISVKIPIDGLMKLGKMILNFIFNYKRLKIVKIFLRNIFKISVKNKVRGLGLPVAVGKEG
jgi:hypothetical protein